MLISFYGFSPVSGILDLIIYKRSKYWYWIDKPPKSIYLYALSCSIQNQLFQAGDEPIPEIMNIEAYFKITYGLYVVSTCHENKLNGYVSNTVFQVTAEPARFAIACSKNNHTTGMIQQSHVFAVSVLQRETRADIMGIFGYRSGRDTEKFTKCNYRLGWYSIYNIVSNISI